MRDHGKTKQQLIAENEELRRRVAALEAAGEFSDGLLRSMQDGLSILDKNGVHIDVNDAFCRMTGFSREELVGVGSPHPYWPPEAIAEIEEAFLDTLEDRGCQFELTFTRKSGERFPVTVTPSAVKDQQGNVVSYFASVKDITERKRAEAALLESEERFRVLAENATDIIYRYRFRPTPGFEYISPSAAVITGYRVEEFYDDPDLVYRIAHPDDREKEAALRREILASPASHLGPFVTQFVRKDGTTFWAERHLSLIRDESGNVVAVDGVSRDITDRKRAQEALKQAHDELEQKVKERTAELAIFRMFAEASSQGFGMADLDGYITYWNPTLCRFFGEDKPENAVGKHVTAYYPQDYFAKRQNEILPAVMRDGHWQGELLAYSRQGKATPILQNTFLIRDENGTPVRLAVTITDISERKRAEEVLRQSEERYRAVVEDQTEVISRFKADGTFTFASEVYCRFFGKTSQELLGKQWQPVALPDDLPMIEEQLRAMAPSNPIVVIENRVYSGLGQVRWMQFVNRGFFDQEGRLAEVQSVGRDITQRKQAQEALRQSHEELRAIYSGLRDGMLIADAETKRFVRTNARICEMLGYSEEELLSVSVNEIHPAESLPDVLDKFRQNAQGKLWIAEDLPVLRRNGTVFYADIASNTLDYRGRPCVIGFFRDITERKRAEESLRESEQRVRTICDSALDAVIMIDARGKALYWNPAAEQMFGYSSHEMQGREVPAMLAPVRYREDAIRAFAGFGTTGQGRAVGNVLELTALRRDGTEFPVEISVVAFKMSHQWCAAAIIKDITERKKAQEALQREHRTLEHMLRASDHERQVISYDIHDGLAQYVAGAIMQFQTYDQLKDGQPKDAAKAFDAGTTLLRQSHHEARRLISGVRPPILDEWGVVAAIDHLIHDQRYQNGPIIDFQSLVQFERLAPIQENVVYRIIQESLANAAKHSRSPKVSIRLSQQNDQLRVEIRDWGIGFVPEQKRESYGLEGIRERARLLGGVAVIDSTLGEGTRIVVELPVIPENASTYSGGESP